MAAFEESEAGQEYGINFREQLGDMPYNDVATRRVMLQLAYSAAATAGDTRGHWPFRGQGGNTEKKNCTSTICY